LTAEVNKFVPHSQHVKRRKNEYSLLRIFGLAILRGGSELARGWFRLVQVGSGSLRLKDLLGPVTRVKKKRRRVQAWTCSEIQPQRFAKGRSIMFSGL